MQYIPFLLSKTESVKSKVTILLVYFILRSLVLFTNVSFVLLRELA